MDIADILLNTIGFSFLGLLFLWICLLLIRSIIRILKSFHNGKK